MRVQLGSDARAAVVERVQPDVQIAQRTGLAAQPGEAFLECGDIAEHALESLHERACAAQRDAEIMQELDVQIVADACLVGLHDGAEVGQPSGDRRSDRSVRREGTRRRWPIPFTGQARIEQRIRCERLRLEIRCGERGGQGGA